jgi:hypothetical protein
MSLDDHAYYTATGGFGKKVSIAIFIFTGALPPSFCPHVFAQTILIVTYTPRRHSSGRGMCVRARVCVCVCM